MIKSVGDLLQALKAHEEERISSSMPIPHGPTIGAMYEGATKRLLDMAIFDGLGLTVSSGFIKNSRNEISKQIDCMISIGQGTEIPNTNTYLFEISDVVAIIEVKKTLYGAELEDAMDWSRDFQCRVWEPPSTQKAGLLRDAWRSITGQELPEHRDSSFLPYHLEMIYHTLVVEVSTPLRIFIGYEGYVSEGGFRKGLINYLKGLIESGKQHLGGPRSLPDIMISRDSSIFKLNGMPYPGSITSDGFWTYLASKGVGPLHVLLEFVWTRLSYRFGLSPDIFGEDLEREGVNILLSMKAIHEANRKGWEYQYIEDSEEKLSEGNLTEPWEPVEVSNVEGTILTVLGTKHEIHENDPDFLSLIASTGVHKRDVIKSLCDKRLIYCQNGIIRYLTDECVVIFLPDGRVVAGDNKSGQMTRWMVKKHTDKDNKTTG